MMDKEDLKELSEELRSALLPVAESITAIAAPGTDAAGGTVTSLTEATMGITAGLCNIASAIEAVADAISEHAEAVKEAAESDG